LWPCSPQFPKQIPVFFLAAATEKKAWIRGKCTSPDYACVSFFNEHLNIWLVEVFIVLLASFAV